MLDQATVKIPVSGLNGAILAGDKPLAVVYSLAWLSAAGTALFAAALLTALLLRMPARQVGETFAETLRGLRLPLLTIAGIVGFAPLANYSGMSLALGGALTVTGSMFPLVSPLIGWLGVFISGSDTASNALFGNMQKAAVLHPGLNPVLTIAANTDGGVIGKMISPQSIAAASSGLVGQEGQLFRRTLPHSLALVVIVCLLTYLQAHALSGMVPLAPPQFVFAAGKPGVAALGWGGISLLSLSLVTLAVLAGATCGSPPGSPRNREAGPFITRAWEGINAYEYINKTIRRRDRRL